MIGCKRLFEKPNHKDTKSTKGHKESLDNHALAYFFVRLCALCVFVVTFQTVSKKAFEDCAPKQLEVSP